MHIQIRQTDRHQTLQEYRAAQARAWLQRNHKKINDEFWERKRRDHEDGQRWLAEHAPDEVDATVAAR